MPLPRHGHPLRCRRNLEEDDIGLCTSRQHMNARKRQSARPLDDLRLESARLVQRVRVAGIFASGYGTCLVVDAEDQPRAFRSAQVRLVGKRREIPADLVRREVLVAALEFDDLVFPIGDQAIQQRSHFLFSHALSPFAILYHITLPLCRGEAACPRRRVASSSRPRDIGTALFPCVGALSQSLALDILPSADRFKPQMIRLQEIHERPNFRSKLIWMSTRPICVHTQDKPVSPSDMKTRIILFEERQ